MIHAVDNINVVSLSPLLAPKILKEKIPVTEKASETISSARAAIAAIIEGRDKRLLTIVGPCSIHDEEAALEYAERLLSLKTDISDRLCIVMRVYFEKPRTTTGWKGLINDPHIDNSYDIKTGLQKARGLLLKLATMGMPAASEVLDPIIPQYIADLLSWASIGARTAESQTHREMASGLSMPIGFKNNTDGNLQSAIDALTAAKRPHHFLGIDNEGHSSVIHTRGNQYGHIILRGGRSGPNYDPVSVMAAEKQLEAASIAQGVMVDCSHANCGKFEVLQGHVLHDVIQQRLSCTTNIFGVMLESNLREGRQDMATNNSELEYGLSITDPCMGWERTEALLRKAHEKLSI
ncbi:MAG: 3-deoxy-7-phosphoheptulonate synthase [Candidatus Hydrogenedentes bacterium]|nr:3-deoxy-7-phosphoheptulonate synthase [Candidatus Hydrogenedentota bacterium]